MLLYPRQIEIFKYFNYCDITIPYSNISATMACHIVSYRNPLARNANQVIFLSRGQPTLSVLLTFTSSSAESLVGFKDAVLMQPSHC